MSDPWRRHQFLRRFWQNLFLLFLILLVGGSLFTFAAFAWVSRDLPNPNALSDRSVAQSTKIYDRTGEHILYEIHGGKKRTLVKLENIPDAVKLATISVEDQQFYKHSGFNPVRIIKGIVLGTLLRGRPQGGSTITQQLVKNAILTNDRTIVRKIKELLLSVAIEQRYTKDEILQLYLNEIPYGSTNYGVESASFSYFGKSVKEVGLAEAATLAALPKAPTRYLNNAELLDNRRDTVLELMFNEGYISREEADLAQAEEVVLLSRVENIVAPHFVFYVKEQLVDDFTERTVEQGGLKVTTTLDYDKQMLAEEAITAGVEARGEAYGFENASLVSLDPKSGEILAMVGSKDYFDEEIDGAVNVTLRPRQPGSSIKPMVYTAGFLRGYTPKTILYDVVTTFKTELSDYTPHDYNADIEFGPITVRQALQGSLNIPAVKMLSLVGVQNFLDFAQTLGYSTFEDRSRFGLSVVLGGGEVTLLDHTSAYGALATEGLLRQPVSILKVEGSDGRVLFERTPDAGTRVVDQNTARMTSNVLSDNGARAYIFGENNFLTLGERPVAAKTGTTNDYHDAWTVGYTPSLVTGVWVGNNDNEAMARGADGSVVAAPIWNAYMRQALDGSVIESFTVPEIPTRGKAILDGYIPTTTVTIDRASGKLATDRTPKSYKETIVCGEYHSILHYVDPSDPLGDSPKNPSENAQYTNWETAITSWMERQNTANPNGPSLTRCDVPTEEDDVHTKVNEPEVRIEWVSVDTREVEIRLEAEAPRGVSRIEYFINGAFVAQTDAGEGGAFTLPSWVGTGKYNVTATAYDDVDNAGSDEFEIDVESEAPEASIAITSPINGQDILKTQTTYLVVVEVDGVSDVKSVELRVESTNGSRVFDGKVENPSSPFVTFTWTLPDEGIYTLSATLKREGDEEERADDVRITVTDQLDASAFDLAQ